MPQNSYLHIFQQVYQVLTVANNKICANTNSKGILLKPIMTNLAYIIVSNNFQGTKKAWFSFWVLFCGQLQHHVSIGKERGIRVTTYENKKT